MPKKKKLHRHLSNLAKANSECAAARKESTPTMHNAPVQSLFEKDIKKLNTPPLPAHLNRPDLSSERSTRAFMHDIRDYLMQVHESAKEAEEMRKEALEVRDYLQDRINSLPPELTLDQASMLQVFGEVNATRNKPLSLYLMRKLLKLDPLHINRLARENRFLKDRVSTLEERVQSIGADVAKTKKASKKARKRKIAQENNQQHKQKIVKEMLQDSAYGKNGYTANYRHGMVSLASHCNSTNSTPMAMRDTLKTLFPFMKDEEIAAYVPHRSTDHDWTIHEAEYDLMELSRLMGNRPFGIILLLYWNAALKW
jgi:hypothetical protein